MIRTRREQGYSTVVTAGLMLVVLMFTAVGVAGGKAVAEQHAAAGAADLVALASAGALQRGQDACGTAEAVAVLNDVQVTACDVRGADVVIAVERRLRLIFGISARVRAQARAGP